MSSCQGNRKLCERLELTLSLADQQIRIYDTTGKSWRLIQQVEARDIGWSIIDTDFSPDSVRVVAVLVLALTSL